MTRDLKEGLAFVHSLAEWKGTADFGLEKTRAVLNLLGDPQDKIPAVHITGTNGKGSVSVGTSSIFAAAGKRVGLTISPHLSEINERIVLDGSSINDEKLDLYARAVQKAAIKAGVTLSFFEGMTIIAFQAFAEEKVDLAVLEVGLGGRLDATNVIKESLASAIVSISLDHADILGNTEAKIASEKAGIIKNGGRIVVGPVSAEAREVIEAAARANSATLNLYDREFGVRNEQFNSLTGRYHGEFWSKLGSGLTLEPGLTGAHQLQNMAVASQIAKTLGVNDRHIEQGIRQAFWPARLELAQTAAGGGIIIDSAHNEAGIAALVKYITDTNLAPISIVFGALDTKDWRKMCQALIPHVSEWKLLLPDSSRALSTETLASFLREKNCKVEDFSSDYGKVAAVINRRVDPKPIFVAGSMYMGGKLRAMLGLRSRPLWQREISNNLDL